MTEFLLVIVNAALLAAALLVGALLVVTFLHFAYDIFKRLPGWWEWFFRG